MDYGEYWTEIGELAESICKEARERGEDPTDVLHETVDGHQWVIYTAQARDVLSHSPNDEAIFEELGRQTIDGFSLIYSQAAYFAMQADIMAHANWQPDAEEGEYHGS